MESSSGVVGKVNPRNTKVGITYSFVLDGPDDKWYGTFKDTPPQEGQYVEFEYVTNGAGFHNVDMKTLTTTAAPEGSTDVVPAPAKKAFAASSNKDANIQWQSARNAAINLVGVAVEAGAISLGGGKAEAKLEAMLIQVNRISLDFFDQSMEVSQTGDAPEDFRG